MGTGGARLLQGLRVGERAAPSRLAGVVAFRRSLAAGASWTSWLGPLRPFGLGTFQDKHLGRVWIPPWLRHVVPGPRRAGGILVGP